MLRWLPSALPTAAAAGQMTGRPYRFTTNPKWNHRSDLMIREAARGC